MIAKNPNASFRGAEQTENEELALMVHRSESDVHASKRRIGSDRIPPPLPLLSPVPIVWLAVREWEIFAWLETRYEGLVTHLQRDGRRVIEFLGLPWQDDQARFYEKSQTKQFYLLT